MDRLIPEQRRDRLQRLVEREGVVGIRAAAAELGVSPMTVRRDLARLEHDGAVQLVSGGFRAPGGSRPPAARGERASLHASEKVAIAAAAARHVEPGAVIYLDAGTTCEAMVPHLAGMDGLTVVTNDFRTTVALIAIPAVRVLHVGGELDPVSGSSGGRFAVRTVRDIAIDVCFLSTGSWSIERGVTADELEKVDLKESAMAAAARTYLLTDASKYGASGRFRVCDLADLDGVVTDRSLAASVFDAVGAAGVAVELAG